MHKAARRPGLVVRHRPGLGAELRVCNKTTGAAHTIPIHLLSSACGDRATISNAISRISLSVAQQPDSARQSAAFWAGLSA
eukprot:6211754-Pleurochrysis_carterae.AAC.2